MLKKELTNILKLGKTKRQNNFYQRIINQDRLAKETYIESLPIPSNLKNLTPALQVFVEFFELDPALLKRVAEQSLDVAETSLDPTQLFEHEKNTFLQRVINNDPLVSVDLQTLLTQKMMG